MAAMAAMAAPLIVSVIWSLTLAKTWQKRAHEDLNKKRLMNLNLPGLKVRNSERWDFDVFRCFLYVVFLNHVISYWLIYIYIWPLVYHSLSYCNCWEMLRAGPSDPWWLACTVTEKKVVPPQGVSWIRSAFLCRRLCFGVLKADDFPMDFRVKKKATKNMEKLSDLSDLIWVSCLLPTSDMCCL